MKWNGLYRRSNQKVEEFILEYNSVCKEAESKGIGDFEVIKAFKLLDASCLESVERQLVFTGIDFKEAKDKKNIYDQMQSAIKKFKGEQSKIIQGGGDRIDSVFLSQNEDIRMANISPVTYVDQSNILRMHVHRKRRRRRNHLNRSKKNH